jgi:rubrerythrin
MPTIWETAKQIETEGKALYLEMSQRSGSKGLKNAFRLLAREEQKHWDLFDSLEKSMPAESAASAQLEGLSVKSVFEDLRGELSNGDQATKAMHDTEYAYGKAITLEEKSIEFYEKISADLSDTLQKSIISQIISEEQRHERFLRDLQELVRRPKQWLEDAEVRHTDDY